jgi:aquaporin Z
MLEYLVEFIGSLLFVFVALTTNNPFAIGATFAFILLIAQPISGGCINPVLAIVKSSSGILELNQLFPYCVAEIMGGMVALELYKLQGGSG